jgi:hypothetical protein
MNIKKKNFLLESLFFLIVTFSITNLKNFLKTKMNRFCANLILKI